MPGGRRGKTAVVSKVARKAPDAGCSERTARSPATAIERLKSGLGVAISALSRSWRRTSGLRSVGLNW